MAKQEFKINNQVELTETPSIKTPFSLHKAVSKKQQASIVQLFSVPVDPLKENDPYYNNFKNFVTGLEKLAEEPQSNIPVLLSYGVTETCSYPFIEMACIEGESVNRYLSRHKFLDINEIVKLTRVLSRSLAHCHNLDIIHGIISDKYIIYSSTEGKYILTGFGLSVFTPEMRTRFIETITKDCLATEVKTGALLPQTDIYDFGCLLYKLLTGSTPPELNKISAQKFNEEIARLRKTFISSQSADEAELNIPVWLSDLIYKCLQKDPDLRFNNGVELYDFILFNNLARPGKEVSRPAENIRMRTKVLNVEEKTAVTPIPPRVIKESEQTRSKTNKQKGLLITAGLLLILLLAGMFIYTNNRNKNANAVAVSDTVSAPPTVITQITKQIRDSVIGNSEKTAGLNNSERMVVHNNNLAKRPDSAIKVTPTEKKLAIRHPLPDNDNTAKLIHPWKPEGSTLDRHSGLENYRVISKAYFYNEPNENTRRRAFIVHWNNVLLKPIKEQNDFIYIVFTNSLGQTSKGWLRKKDLVQSEK